MKDVCGELKYSEQWLCLAVILAHWRHYISLVTYEIRPSCKQWLCLAVSNSELGTKKVGRPRGPLNVIGLTWLSKNRGHTTKPSHKFVKQ